MTDKDSKRKMIQIISITEPDLFTWLMAVCWTKNNLSLQQHPARWRVIALIPLAQICCSLELKCFGPYTLFSSRELRRLRLNEWNVFGLWNSWFLKKNVAVVCSVSSFFCWLFYASSLIFFGDLQCNKPSSWIREHQCHSLHWTVKRMKLTFQHNTSLFLHGSWGMQLSLRIYSISASQQSECKRWIQPQMSIAYTSPREKRGWECT